MKYAGVKRRGRRNGRRKREGERASGWYHVLNQTKRNVLGLHEGWSVTRAELRGEGGIGWWWWWWLDGWGPEKGWCSSHHASFPQRLEGWKLEEEEEEEAGCSQREKTMGRNGVDEEEQGKFRRCISPRRRATLRVNGGLERVRDSTRQPRLHLTEWNLSTVPWDVE